jgi:hypothetical protein
VIHSALRPCGQSHAIASSIAVREHHHRQGTRTAELAVFCSRLRHRELSK